MSCMGAPRTELAPRPPAGLRGLRPTRGVRSLLALVLASTLGACRKPEEPLEAPIVAPSDRVKAPPPPETVHEAWKGATLESSATAAPAASKAAPKVSALRAGTIVLDPGQHAYFEAKAVGPRVTLVRELDSPGTTPLVIEVTLKETDKGFSLTVQNPFPQWLSYRVSATTPGKIAAARAACNIAATSWAAEEFPETTTKVTLSTFTLADKETPCTKPASP